MILSLDGLETVVGCKNVDDFSGRPDEEGVLIRYEVEVPDFDYGCYFAANQKYDFQGPDLDHWPNGSNRVQPLRIENFRDLKRGGLFLLLKLRDGDCLAILPLAGTKTGAWFHSDGDSLILNLGTLGTASVEGDLPVCAFARSADPFVACREAWKAALENELVGNSTRFREEKHYPEVFRYLGWCSWEEYLKEIDEKILLDALEAIESSPYPIRYFLVDDGHLDSDSNVRILKSFEPNQKFPNGWKSLMEAPREKVRWMGLWLNFNGYWDGILPENDLGELNEHLAPVASGVLQPRRGLLSSFAFYNGMVAAARRAGFDFIKVDNQAKNWQFYEGGENPAECAIENAQALEAMTARHMDGLINCMAQNIICVMNTRISAVTRCSEDYKKGDLIRARRHIHNSYGNIPWAGQTVWGDHDMFHSNDALSGSLMAISKALSGGPIYLSDNPRDFNGENITPFCYQDGELLRPLAPACPLPESLFANPLLDGKPYRVIAPLDNGVAAVAAYNLTEPEVEVSGVFCAEDYVEAPAMMQPYEGKWVAPEEGLLAYDWRSGKARRLGDGYGFTLNGFTDVYVLLCPITKGWAVVGRPDKYLSPCAVEILEIAEDRLIVRMKETGPLAIWTERGVVSVESAEGCHVGDLGDGLFIVVLPVGEKNEVFKINREA